jgi:ribosomal protein L40E
MICKKCKANIPNGAKFCPKCGAAVKIAKAQDIRTKKCPSCGAENPPSAKFCKVDGYQLQKTKKKIVEKTKKVIYCPKCGTKNRPTAKFCKKDGAPLGKEVILPPGQQKFIGVSPPKAQKEGGNFSRWIWWTILGLFLVLGGIGTYLYFSEKIIIKHPKEVSTKKAEKIVKPPADIAKEETDIAKLERNINSELKNRGLSYVYASVDSQLTATLEGTVYDLRDKMMAEKIAESFGKINKVKNYIVVNQFRAPVRSTEPNRENVPPPPAPPLPSLPRR